MNATAYARVSSKAQPFELQRQHIEREASARGDELRDWREEKRSGKTLDRPELDRLRADVRAGKVRKLYVYRLDRLTRSGIRDTFELVEELRKAGTALVSTSEPWLDLTGPFADIILAVMAWAAQMERQAINERIAARREQVEAAGGAWGRPSRMGRELREQARALRAEGKTLRQVAVALKVPRATLARALKGCKCGAPDLHGAAGHKPGCPVVSKS